MAGAEKKGVGERNKDKKYRRLGKLEGWGLRRMRWSKLLEVMKSG